MRLSLLPGLLKTLNFNLHREAISFHSFEVGKVFTFVDGIAGETRRLAGVSYGDYAMGGVDRPGVKAGFFSLKGVLETCFRAMGMQDRALFEPAPPDLAPYLHPGRAARFSFDGSVLGLIGELHPAEAMRLELIHPCVLFEVDFSNLVACSTRRLEPLQPPPRFPVVRRDLALVLDREFPADVVVRTLSALNIDILENVELFDIYQGESVPDGRKSVALACRYRAKDRTLTDEEVNRAHSEVIEQARARLGAELRL
jgi:phenylalanyl-tRNA synthetase beta chain